MSCFNILLYAFLQFWFSIMNVHDFYGKAWGSMDHKVEKYSKSVLEANNSE